MAYSLSYRVEGDTHIFIFDGALDTEAAAEVMPLVKRAFLSEAKKLVFDLAKVPYVSSMGLGVFVTAIKTFPGTVVFAALQPYVRQTFKLAAFDKIATLVNSVDDALKS